MWFGADRIEEAVLRIHGFARTQRNCVASSAALRLEKKRFLAMSSLRSTPQAGKCAVPNLQPAVPDAPLRWKCRDIVDLGLFSWLPEGFRGIELYQRFHVPFTRKQPRRGIARDTATLNRSECWKCVYSELYWCLLFETLIQLTFDCQNARDHQLCCTENHRPIRVKVFMYDSIPSQLSIVHNAE